MIPFKTFNICTHFKVPLLFSTPKKEQILQTLSTKVSTGLFIQQILIKAQNVWGTGVSKRRQICPCFKDILVFSKWEADTSPTTIHQFKADITAFLQSNNTLQFSLNYLHESPYTETFLTY